MRSYRVARKLSHPKFLTVVVDHERGRVVWAAEGKSSETLGQFFELLGAEHRAGSK